MTRCLLRPRAQRDLNEIWNYSAESWSVDQAESVWGLRGGSGARIGPSAKEDVVGTVRHAEESVRGIALSACRAAFGVDAPDAAHAGLP